MPEDFPAVAIHTWAEGANMTTRYAGIALMASIVLVFVSSLFLPGNTFISPVDRTDFPASLRVLGDSAVLAHWMTFMELISMLLMSFGLLGLYPLARRQAGLGGSLLQFGIIVSVIEWTILIVAAGMRHFVIHLMQRSQLPPDGSLSAADFQAAALDVYINMAGIIMTLMALFPLATIMVGIGLSSRFASMGLLKITSYVLAATGLVGLVNFLIALNAPQVGIIPLVMANSAVLTISGICLFIIGLGMYQGRSELSDEVSSI